MAGPRATRFRLAGGEFVVLSERHEEQAWAGLTHAEREVLEGVLAGHSNARIAAGRGTSAWTVANQLTAIYRKLGVSSRFELIALAGHAPEGLNGVLG